MALENGNAVAKIERPIDLFKSVINAPSVQAQFNNALGAHKDAFVASLIDVFTGDKSLQNCKPQLIVSEALRAATLKLPLNKSLGFAYLVAYNNTVKNPDGSFTKVPTPTFIPGYKGYIQLAMRTGQYRTLNADYVYEGEMQKVNKLTGEIAFDGDKKSDKIIGYFCYFELLNGFNKTMYVSVEDMAAYAKRYATGISKNTTVEQLIAKANDGIVSKKIGWEGNFNDMALKTVIRKLLGRYGYLSVEMQTALQQDNKETDLAERNDLIADNANKKTYNLDSIEITDVSVSGDESQDETKDKKDDVTPPMSGENLPDY